MTHMTDAPMYWRMDRPVSTDIAHLAKQLLKNLSEGLLNDYWTIPVRTEIANEIMNLTSLNITYSCDGNLSERVATEESPTVESDIFEFMNTNNHQPSMLKSGKFWLAVAALSLLKESQWLELSSIWQSFQVNFLSLTIKSSYLHNKDKATELIVILFLEKIRDLF
ncbi:unnamed protein product [Onchocerca flexuosa]|uniref:Cyclin N-terminal domain-containing protein n=1 Tax=Onchocerca flexuosa TaxID=387005 RepID=A0A183HW02_9BILA|nr:unnamed protein product [Onchocerca flexuosa]